MRRSPPTASRLRIPTIATIPHWLSHRRRSSCSCAHESPCSAARRAPGASRPRVSERLLSTTSAPRSHPLTTSAPIRAQRGDRRVPVRHKRRPLAAAGFERLREGLQTDAPSAPDCGFSRHISRPELPASTCPPDRRAGRTPCIATAATTAAPAPSTDPCSPDAHPGRSQRSWLRNWTRAGESPPADGPVDSSAPQSTDRPVAARCSSWR